MADKERYKKFKEMGICAICKHRPSEDGKVTCRTCREKQKKNSRKRRAYLKKIGFCPQCGSEKLVGEEKICPTCSAKKYAWNRASKRTENAKQSAKDRYLKRKEKGVCVRCGKRPAEDKKTRCRICNYIEAKRGRDYRGLGIERNERPSYGECYFCGRPVLPNKRVCLGCYQKCMANISNVTRDTTNHAWRTSEAIRIKLIKNRGAL